MTRVDVRTGPIHLNYRQSTLKVRTLLRLPMSTHMYSPFFKERHSGALGSRRVVLSLLSRPAESCGFFTFFRFSRIGLSFRPSGLCNLRPS